ncbi:MAG: methionine--tRNA ligase subunit beta [Planctomycetes bacterium]|nr:methionine--tRNA ligase subunit beta [Planctomycetota bacterium]
MSTEPSETTEPQSDLVTFNEFVKIKMRVGRVIEAAVHPNADKLLVLQVDLGDEKRQIVAGLKAHYQPEDLVGKNLIIVANLAPRMMRGQESQGMLLAASTADHERVIVLTTDADILPGSEVS